MQRGKIKGYILKGITAMAGMVLIVSASALDSASYLPLMGCLASLAWLVPAVMIADRKYQRELEKARVARQEGQRIWPQR